MSPLVWDTRINPARGRVRRAHKMSSRTQLKKSSLDATFPWEIISAPANLSTSESYSNYNENPSGSVDQNRRYEQLRYAQLVDLCNEGVLDACHDLWLEFELQHFPV